VEGGRDPGEAEPFDPFDVARRWGLVHRSRG
jgi:hypothetical protein